jgi:hypothetical protein
MPSLNRQLHGFQLAECIVNANTTEKVMVGDILSRNFDL